MEIILFEEIHMNATGLSNKAHDCQQISWHENNSALWYKILILNFYKKHNNNVY